MPWTPSTDFEEEIINLQPDHDFIYGGLSEPEPQPIYPRPKSHIEYAFSQKKQAKKQQEQFEKTGCMNEKLHVISQVQRIAGTKSLGEQPTLHDWDTNKNIEKETICMMRFCGLGPSLEEPLSNKVTIASYPIDNNKQIMHNGRRKVPVFFDENIFKLKPRVSNYSSGFHSTATTKNSSNFRHDSISSQDLQSPNTSLNNSCSSTSTNNTNSFCTGEHFSQKSCKSLTVYQKAEIERESLHLKAERMQQNDKLQEETASLSISNHTQDSDSFKTAKDYNPWMGSIDNNNKDKHFTKNEVIWPSLNYNEFKPSAKKHNTSSSSSTSIVTSFANTNTNNGLTTYQNSSKDCVNDKFTTTSNTFDSTKSFLHQFVTPELSSQNPKSPKLGIPIINPITPPSYADMTKNELRTSSQSLSLLPDVKRDDKPNAQSHIQRFYTAREIYDMKRHV